jgi:hypothetical protein
MKKFTNSGQFKKGDPKLKFKSGAHRQAISIGQRLAWKFRAEVSPKPVSEEPTTKLPDFVQNEARQGIPKWVEVAWRKESERANYNAEAAADNLKALQDCQKALAGALAALVLLKAELAEAKGEIKDLKRGGMSWEDATCGDEL